MNDFPMKWMNNPEPEAPPHEATLFPDQLRTALLELGQVKYSAPATGQNNLKYDLQTIDEIRNAMEHLKILLAEVPICEWNDYSLEWKNMFQTAIKHLKEKNMHETQRKQQEAEAACKLYMDQAMYLWDPHVTRDDHHAAKMRRWLARLDCDPLDSKNTNSDQEDIDERDDGRDNPYHEFAAKDKGNKVQFGLKGSVRATATELVTKVTGVNEVKNSKAEDSDVEIVPNSKSKEIKQEPVEDNKGITASDYKESSDDQEEADDSYDEVLLSNNSLQKKKRRVVKRAQRHLMNCFRCNKIAKACDDNEPSCKRCVRAGIECVRTLPGHYSAKKP